MLVDFNENILGLDEKEILQDGKPITARLLVLEALNRLYKDDDKCSGEDRARRANLSINIYNAKDSVHLTSEDVVFIKKYVDKATFSPIVYKRLLDILEGEDGNS